MTDNPRDVAAAMKAHENKRPDIPWPAPDVAYRETLIEAARLGRIGATSEVDPDVLAWRQMAAASNRARGREDWALAYERGDYDTLPMDVAAVKAFRAIKAERGWA